MKVADSVEFEAVDVMALRAAHDAQMPIKLTFANGVVFEELKAGTGAFRKYDPRKGVTLEHSEVIEYRSSLKEQHLASRAN